MSLQWPWALAALLAFPLLLSYRWWVRRLRRRDAVRLPSIAAVRAALPGGTRWRRRIPLWFFATGLVVLAMGAARPQATVPVPANAAAIILAMDVSGSMCTTDVDPNRLVAAQEAARQFIRDQDDGVQIGLVTFSGIAGLLVEPTTDKKKLLSAIDGLRTGRGTAIGLAIMTSIDAIAAINPHVPPTGVKVPDSGATGAYEPDTIIVLTDGRNTQGVDPVTAANEAAARHVRVYTIGFGTDQPAPMVCSRDQIGGDAPFRPEGGPPRSGPGSGNGGGGNGGGGGGGNGGARRYQQIDEETLRQVAQNTGGKYFQAADAEGLNTVFRDLPTNIIVQKRKVELTALFAAAGALLVVVGVGLAQWWNRTGAAFRWSKVRERLASRA
jgi:Ca-activated chloride channel family protein